jgi:predicted NBD/HSP70 family sugar kinase
MLCRGDIYRGSQEMAGEFGHMTLDPAGPECACGDNGCVEAYCSASALLSYARSVAVGEEAVSKVHSVEELAALAALENQPAREAFARMGGQLGIGVANLIDLFNPELVVLAGRSVAGKDYFLPALQAAVEKHAWSRSTRALLVSRLGERATAMGACGMVLEQAFVQNGNHAAA